MFIFAVLISLALGINSFEVYDSGVSVTEQETIVEAHNNYRLQIANGKVAGQPRGTNLKRMSWDDTLAVEAQKVADLGKFEHLIAPDDRFPYGYVGQNLYISMSTGNSATINWSGGIKAWFDEHKDFVYGAQTQAGVTGHYTQVVWADTNLVGCGYVRFYDNVTANIMPAYPYKKLYVCNYGPAGNWVGENPYETGESGCENLC
ncbi:salivary antigen-5-like [Onthophagus taurus]|uniref:salivary antigen-5-like n=1 Tax=Onthophagus taurus TaxID=166361 RepID=UPI000C20F52C|nr:CRISP/Allergen/PR-1-like [Onthophagus taurus]